MLSGIVSLQETPTRLLYHSIENHLPLLTLLSYAFFCISFFGFFATLAFHTLALSILLLLYTKLQKGLQKGLINYTPSVLRQLLLSTSLFDVLCKLWYTHFLTLHIKALLLPFFIEISREEQYSMIEDLNPQFAQILKTEGIVNTFPDMLRNRLLPRAELGDASENSTALSELEHSVHKDSGEVIWKGSHRDQLPGLGRVPEPSTASQAILSKVLENRVKRLLNMVTQRHLGIAGVIGGLGVILQVLLSGVTRRLAKTSFKLLLFLSSFGVLGISFTAILLKYLNRENRIIPGNECGISKKALQRHRLSRGLEFFSTTLDL